VLTQLVDKSLVQMEKAPGHGARYTMLESLWDYSNEKLVEAGESARYRERHLDYFLRFAEEAAPQIIGPDQAAWLKRLEPEDINLRFAAETSWELPGHVEKGLRLLTAVTRFIEVRGLFKKARAAFEQLLAHPDAAPRTAIRAATLAAAGRLAWISDDLETGRALDREAAEIFRELGDDRGLTLALANLALHARDAQELRAAEELIAEAVKLSEMARDSRVTANVRRCQAVLAAADRDFARAFALDQESLTLYRELGDHWMTLIIEWALGVNALVLGRFDEARAHLTVCLKRGVELGGAWGIPFPLEAFAALAATEQQYERAARLLGAAEALRAAAGIARSPADHPGLRAILDKNADALSAHESARREAGAMTADQATAFALSGA
jgi:hypothetical protein